MNSLTGVSGPGRSVGAGYTAAVEWMVLEL